jgi:hypothetical protein
MATGPIVGVLELPISLRSGGTAPADFAQLEISPAEIHVAGLPVLTLSAGAVAAADRAPAASGHGEQLPKLAAALAKGSHNGIALAIGSAVPYETVALVLATAQAAGTHAVAFKVRPPGASVTGWLSLDGLNVHAKTTSDEASAPSDWTKQPWADFASKWDAVQSACRASTTGSCAFKPEKVADGGDLKIVLHAAGQGVNVEYFRLGEPPVAAEAAPAPVETTAKGKLKNKAKSKGKNKHKVELLDGVKRPTDIVDEVESAPPATEALFQFRAQEAVNAPSAITETVKPVCGATRCGVSIQAEKATLFVRVVSLLGAAFPDGASAPQVVFELP